jgi:glycosyltransferase involved in cell wall biosynthesis
MRNKNIKFSVVIPVYNASEFIKDTLDSIKNQTYKNYEVLVTNDGSIDNTEEVLNNYKVSNPKFPLSYITQKNNGVSSARNNAIFKANGNYVAFLDQDDLWFPYKLEKAAEVLSSNMNIDVLYHKAIAVGWGRVNIFLKSRALKEPVYLDLLFNGSKIGISTAVVKRDKLLEVGGFSPYYIYGEDYELWLRLARQGVNFYYLPDFLSKYIWREDSESNKVENMIQEKLEIFEHNFRLIIEEGKYNRRYLSKKYRRAKSVMLFGASRRFYFLNDYKKALDYLILAIKADFKFWKPYIGFFLLYLKSKFS